MSEIRSKTSNELSKNKNNELLGYFWDLSSEDAATRQQSALSIVQHIQSANNKDSDGNEV